MIDTLTCLEDNEIFLEKLRGGQKPSQKHILLEIGTNKIDGMIERCNCKQFRQREVSEVALDYQI